MCTAPSSLFNEEVAASSVFMQKLYTSDYENLEFLCRLYIACINFYFTLSLVINHHLDAKKELKQFHNKIRCNSPEDGMLHVQLQVYKMLEY